MHITLRTHTNLDYWTSRWDRIPVDQAMTNTNAYPLKYALEAVQRNDGPILEAGCGTGRILRYFHERGYDIEGFDFVESVIDRLKETDSSLKIARGDITNLKYDDTTFRYFLAYGLYHNLPLNLFQKGLEETHRVLEPGGFLSASCRADNFQNRLNDIHAQLRSKSAKKDERRFHKINLTKTEFCRLVEQFGFKIIAVHHVENMPFLYKFRVFRRADHKMFDENKGRNEGYQLSLIGRSLQKFVMRNFSDQFCNINVITAQRI
ncbi:MAG: class I SAM-dependent methyltransferase [Verrucomicrobiota bacterium]